MAQHETYWETIEHVLRQEGMEPHPGPFNGLRVIDILERRIEEERVKDPDDYLRLSAIYYEKGDTTKAIQHAKTYTELVPNNPQGHAEIGVLYTFNGFPDEGKISLTKAITLDPTNPITRLQMAGNCIVRQDREGAIENCALFLKAPEDPNDQDNLLLRKDAQQIFYRLVTNTPAFVAQSDRSYRATTVDSRDIERVLRSHGLPY